MARRARDPSQVFDTLDPVNLDGLAGTIVSALWFEIPAALTETVYVGSAGWSSRYVGTRSDAQLYLGANTLR